MKLKLSYIQFMALHNIFKGLFAEDVKPQKAVEARLMICILRSIYIKLHKRSVERLQKYSLSLEEQEALAFWIFFTRYFSLPHDAVFEINLLQTINNSIHQKFCS